MPGNGRRYSYQIRGRRKSSRTSLKGRRRIMRSRPTARNQKRQILSNQNQIAALRRELTIMKHPVTYGGGFKNVSIKSGDTSPMIIPLSSGPKQGTLNTAEANDGSAVFSPTDCSWRVTMSNLGSTTQIRDGLKIWRQYVTMQLAPGNESAYINHQLFLVKLQADVATDVYAETNDMTTMVKHRDYYCQDIETAATAHAQFGVFLNTSRYKIIKKWNLHTVGGNDHISDVYRPSKPTVKFTCNYGGTMVRATGGGPSGESNGAAVEVAGDRTNLESITYDDIDPRHKYFLVAFNDNEPADFEYPTLSMSWLVKGTVS